MASSFPYIALLGGSFNPPHSGHFRMALEVWEAFTPESLLFIPCATPPHKTGRDLLPFEIRAKMLESTIKHLPGMSVCPVEQNRPGPSYTADTLLSLTAIYPGKRLLFILGSGDFSLFSTWSRWQMIPELADLVILPRNTSSNSITSTTHTLWPDVQPTTNPNPSVQKTFALPGGGKIFYLPQPRLEISSSLVRNRWVSERAVDFLVPATVLTLLHEYSDITRKLWTPGHKTAATLDL